MSDKIEFQELRESQGDSDSSSGIPRPDDLPSSEGRGGASVERGEGTPLRDRVALERSQGLKNIIVGFGALSAGVTLALVIQIIAGEPQVKRHGGVTSCASICSEMGIKVLRDMKGNAVDAAVATELCVGVVRPQFAGIGGGGLMLIHNHKDKKHPSLLLDFRESAPMGTPLGEKPKDDFRRTGKGVGVPGEVAGLWEAYHRLGSGRVEWKDLLQLVIDLARDGFPTPDEWDIDLRRRHDDVKWQEEAYPDYSDRFLKMFRRKEGRIRRPELAAALEAIAEKGPDVLYKGDLGQEMVDAVQDVGGSMTMEDLNNYQVKEPTPLTTTIQGHKILTFPVPSAGSVMLRMLNDMNKSEEFRKSGLGSPKYYAELAKILNTAYPCKNLLGDEESSGSVEKRLLNPELESGVVCGKREVPESKGTSHINVVDADELMVSLTSSMNGWFGSLIVTKSGILLNDQLDDFSQDSDSANAMGPGKRPITNMVPTVVFNEKRPCKGRMAIGGVNGSKIFTGVAQTVGNMLFFDGRLKPALDVPRLFCNGTKTCLLSQGERPDRKDVVDEVYKETGLAVDVVEWSLSVVGAIMINNNTMVAATDHYQGWNGTTY